MADVIDHSDEVEMRLLNHRIAAQRTQGRELQPVGECHWCENPFVQGSPKLFCDADCSYDWERSKRK